MILKKSTLIPNQTIQICGSKSISNRLLILHSLFNNIKISNLSNSQDTELLQKALESNETVIDIHHAGTAMRFLASYFAIQPNREVILTGSERMKQRPIQSLVEALKDLGADIDYLENEGFPPLKIKGKKIIKNKVKIPTHISSQFITSLLLIGAKLPNGLDIELVGKIISRPYIEMTLNILRDIGIDCSFEERTISIKKLIYDDTKSHIFFYEVESDWSSASYYYSLSALSRKNINLKSFKLNSYQGDSALMKIYRENFGVNTIIDSSKNIISLIPQSFEFPEIIQLDMNDCPDIAQTVCVTAAALNIPFEITGLSTLKVKETDRLFALKNELEKLGCKTEITDDSIKSIVFSAPKEKISIATYNDHRMAMSFAPYCLIRNINIEHPEVIDKSYPKFWEDLKSILD